MKFLKFFDTRVDVEELEDAIKKHWKWNVILVKYHWIKLLSTFFLTLISLWLLVLMVYIINVNYVKWSKSIFYWLAFFYFIITFIWSWLTIYWIFKIIRFQIWQKKKYIEDVKVALQMKKRFEFFLKFSLVIFIIHILFVIINASVPFVYDYTWKWNLSVPIFILILDFLFLANVSFVMYKMIDYEMNFWVCSPNSFKLFKQVWLLSSDVSDISPQSVNIIKYNCKWLVQQLFHFWSVCLYTDAEIRTLWWSMIELVNLPDPKNLVKKLNQILDKE